MADEHPSLNIYARQLHPSLESLPSPPPAFEPPQELPQEPEKPATIKLENDALQQMADALDKIAQQSSTFNENSREANNLKMSVLKKLYTKLETG